MSDIIPVEIEETTSTEIRINWSSFQTDEDIDHFRVSYDCATCNPLMYDMWPFASVCIKIQAKTIGHIQNHIRLYLYFWRPEKRRP